MESVVVATRIHKASSSTLAQTSRVVEFVRQCSSYAGGVFICVDIKEDLSDIEYFNHIKSEIANVSLHVINENFKIIVIPISIWGNFTFALNVAVYKAMECKYKYIIFQSIEFTISPFLVEKLYQEMASTTNSNDIQTNIETLVVGPSMDGHEFSVETSITSTSTNASVSTSLSSSSTTVTQLRGRTCPWNTMIGDGLIEEWGGVEEVTTVALLQRLRPNIRAVLVKFMYRYDDTHKTIDNNNTIESERMTISWDTDFKNDPIRLAYHMKKMLSKDTRPKKQLQHLGLDIDSLQTVVHHKIIYI